MTDNLSTKALIERLRLYQYDEANEAADALERLTYRLDVESASLRDCNDERKAAEAQVEALRKALEEIAALSKKELGMLLHRCGKIAEAALASSTPESSEQPDLDRAWAAVNVLGAPDTACRNAEDLAYCAGINDALTEIEKLGGQPS